MSTQIINHGDRTINEARVRAVIEVARVWLGIGEGRKVRQMAVLAPDQLLGVLQSGECAVWNGWSVKATPPRRVESRPGEAEWAAGIVAESSYGFVSGLRVAADCVQRVCAEIMAIEKRRTTYVASEESRAELRESEFEDS
jgi:hypothetical protein